jgi:hypothetical protein
VSRLVLSTGAYAGIGPDVKYDWYSVVLTETSAWVYGTSIAGMPFGYAPFEVFPKKGLTVAVWYPL